MKLNNLNYLGSDIIFTPDGLWLIVGSDMSNWFSGDAFLISLDSSSDYYLNGFELGYKSLNSSYTRSLDISPDGRWLAVLLYNEVH